MIKLVCFRDIRMVQHLQVNQCDTTLSTPVQQDIRSPGERAESRSKKNYNPAVCGTKSTFTERQDEKAEGYVPDEGRR